MFKALLKKQFMELNVSFFRSKKTGEKKSRGAAIRGIIVFALLMVFVGVMFYLMTGMFSGALLDSTFGDTSWFYFSIMSLMAILLGTFGSVFNTMASLYKAKDNELLLSMPVPPRMILIMRLIGVYAMSLLYSAVVWIPTVIRYWSTRSDPGAASVIFCIILTFLIALLVTVLACAAGWVVALISGKLKNRSIVTVVISLILFGLYYFVCFRLNSIITAIAMRSAEIGDAMKVRAYPIYALGRAATGDAFSMLIFTLIVIGLFILCCVILSRSFVRIVTTNKGMKKAVYKEKTAKAQKPAKALFGRELRRFTKSPSYMLNCGLGLVILPVAAILLLIYQGYVDQLLNFLQENMPGMMPFIPVALCLMVCLTSSMNMITAPSVSLEGRTIWTAQSLPVRTMDILSAKLKLHIVMNLPSLIFSMLILGHVIHATVPERVMMLIAAVLFTVFSACFGLRLNLKHPNLSWNNESVPIKQSLPIAIGLFGGWGICVAVGFVYFFLSGLIPPVLWLAICCVLLILVIFLQMRWLGRKGSEIFMSL